jgi:hypothetical protein
MLESYIVLDAAAVLHIRFLDYRFDLLLAELDLPHRPSVEQIKRAVAAVLEMPVCNLKYFLLDRHDDGGFTLRT